jgi:hypothetical protein
MIATTKQGKKQTNLYYIFIEMTLPVKSLSEIEVKSEVSENDKILILDSVSEEARLAIKDEIKGED